MTTPDAGPEAQEPDVMRRVRDYVRKHLDWALEPDPNGNTRMPGQSTVVYYDDHRALVKYVDALLANCAALAGERDELKVQNFALRERTGQLTALEDVHRKRYENLREALGQNIPTGEQIVGASIAAIHERNELRAQLDRVRALPRRDYDDVISGAYATEWVNADDIDTALAGGEPC